MGRMLCVCYGMAARCIVQLHLFTSVSDKLELYLYRQVSLQRFLLVLMKGGWHFCHVGFLSWGINS